MLGCQNTCWNILWSKLGGCIKRQPIKTLFNAKNLILIALCNFAYTYLSIYVELFCQPKQRKNKDMRKAQRYSKWRNRVCCKCLGKKAKMLVFVMLLESFPTPIVKIIIHQMPEYNRVLTKTPVHFCRSFWTTQVQSRS